MIKLLILMVLWAPNPPEDGVVGYKLCHGTQPRVYECLDVGNTTSQRIVIPYNSPLYFAVISYDSAGYQSDYSPEYVYFPLSKPENVIKIR